MGEKDKIRKVVRNELENKKFSIRAHVSRQSGFRSGLVYLSLSKSYAIAYANGQTSAAHAIQTPIKNGALFYVCLKDYENHYGGDTWVSGFKDEILEDLKNYISKNKEFKQGLTRDFLIACGYDENPDIETVKFVYKHVLENDLSIISPVDLSWLEEEQQGYSEIALKEIPFEKIIKCELYLNGELVKVIRGGYKGECENIFYHGSPLEYWKFLL